MSKIRRKIKKNKVASLEIHFRCMSLVISSWPPEQRKRDVDGELQPPQQRRYPSSYWSKLKNPGPLVYQGCFSRVAMHHKFTRGHIFGGFYKTFGPFAKHVGDVLSLILTFLIFKYFHL